MYLVLQSCIHFSAYATSAKCIQNVSVLTNTYLDICFYNISVMDYVMLVCGPYWIMIERISFIFKIYFYLCVHVCQCECMYAVCVSTNGDPKRASDPLKLEL